MQDIRGYDTFTKIEPIAKGWSSDKKYYIETVDGKRLLMRVADISKYDRKKAEFEMMQRVSALGVPMSAPVEFGVCNGGKSVYSLLTWVDGEDADSLLPRMSETEQYLLGHRAGTLLNRLHTLPAPKNDEPWSITFHKRLIKWIDYYHEHIDLCSEDTETIITYLQSNMHLLTDRPQTFIHSDYNASNLIAMPDGNVGIIDFNSFGSSGGDPWWDFYFMGWEDNTFPHFYTGLLNGYFQGQPPAAFFQVLSYYLAFSALAPAYDVSLMNEETITDGKRYRKRVLSWFDNMNSPMPTWYLKNYHVQRIDGIPCRLKEPYDFSFLSEYGKVFKVFDAQSSGCICFGVSNGESRYFIKFAGVRTINNFDLPVCDAVARLKAAAPKYQDLRHPLLIRLLEAKEAGGGFMLVFDWEEGESFSKEQPFAHEKFTALPPDEKIRVFEEILRFHTHVADCGYVAMDFNDYSTLYHFETGEVKICDIDFYARQSYINGMGKALGDPAVMSPEEFRIGGLVNEVSNVYTMGATAFVLFAEGDRSREAWPLNEKLYEVVRRATSEERSQRQQSVKQLVEEWNAAKY